jgi:hypothetical protein
MVKDKYKPPQVLTRVYNETLRKEKEELAEIKESLTKVVAYDMPRASKEKVDAVVYRKMYEEKHIAKEPEDPELTLRPDMTKTLRNTKQKEYYHNGKWEMNPIEKQECWSCCMNAEKDSAGCVAVIKDK